MTRALVTGAAGFVGANLCRTLLREGHEVHAVVRPGSDAWRLSDLRKGLVLHALSLVDADEISALIGSVAPKWLFHLAAHGAYSWQSDLDGIFGVNAVGGAHLVDAALAHGVAAFVQAGSSSEYGFKDHAPDEQEWIEPNSAYAVSKAAATHYARAAALREDRHLVTLRLYSVFGPWEEPNRLLPALALHGMRGGLPPLVDPRVARDYVYVDDVCRAFVAAAERPDLARGTVLNLASGRQTNLGELVELVRAELDIAIEPAWESMRRRGWDTNEWVGDPRRCAAELGWTASTPLSEGFRHLVAWLRAEPRRRDLYEQRLRTLTSGSDTPGAARNA